MEYTNLSVDEIQQQLAQIEQSRADLEAALERRRQEAKSHVAQQVRDLIVNNGYDLNEILPLVSLRKRRGPAPKKAASGHQYTRYADPQNPQHIYVRGVIPGWMKQRMQEEGYDAASKQDREAFKANYLTVLEG